MSEAKVRWGVTVLVGPGGLRKRTMRDGAPIRYNFRCNALSDASRFVDESEPRLVKLTRRAKGWRPASEPPKPTQVNCDLLVRLDNGARRTAHWNTLCWHGTDSALIYCNVTHWRELPAGPK